MSNRKINYQHLSQWCQNLRGQVIVCENTKSDWLPFLPFISQHGIKHRTTEAIWCNHLTGYEMQQQTLFR
jgi:hypothetical protein